MDDSELQYRVLAGIIPKEGNLITSREKPSTSYEIIILPTPDPPTYRIPVYIKLTPFAIASAAVQRLPSYRKQRYRAGCSRDHRSSTSAWSVARSPFVHDVSQDQSPEVHQVPTN